MSDGTTGAGSTPAGWYPDPHVAGQQRWWDGTAWTDHTAALSGQQPQQQSWGTGGVPTSAPMGAAAGAPPDVWLWQSILATVLCCLPLGIVGIVFSSQAQAAINVGNLAEAHQKAQQARTFTLISMALGLLPMGFLILWILGMSTMLMGW